MKAMILAAGLGTRLLPFTESTPKPLFTISGRPLLDIIIHSLQSAGCEAVIINTHHLYKNIDSFLASQHYAIPVYTLYEPVILGPAGAIKNAAYFWDTQPFMVINSDIFTDIDLRKVYDFHLSHNHHATLVLHDCAEFNNVWVDKNDFITGFQGQGKEANAGHTRKLTFTGIQVLDPEILELIPDKIFSGSVGVYRKLILSGKKIKAYISKKYYWKDIGTSERYKETVFDKMAPQAFKKAFPGCVCKKIECSKLKEDGSDRKWHRLTASGRSIVMVDHGIRKEPGTSEIDSFVLIGRHLYDKGISVPAIYLYDTFSGIVFLEDLGDVNLQAMVKAGKNLKQILSYYKSIIKLLIKMSVFGVKEFDRSWPYQTSYYDKEVILENECRYFVDAFLRRYLKLNICYDDFEDEFILLADKALEFSVNGFMHRDLQSRNIMIKDRKPYFIDFQGGRIGPIQYDLASLLIDPYVALSRNMQDQLLDYCVDKLSSYIHIDKKKFCLCYKYCAITRNLQMLGAFGYLSRVKGKTYFEQFIPAAVKTLRYNLSADEGAEFPRLKSVVNSRVVE
ncbi:MAG: sugar phosphate nucleotidyltransferase [Thermodesulfobacteriota bacterium]|nr:sugar phosphate nucleotidyltransferase [Thermodesulfobacteriota bacterium]